MDAISVKSLDNIQPNLSLELVKSHLRLGDDTTQDDYLNGLITTSLQIITGFIGDPFVDTAYEAFYPTSTDPRLDLPHANIDVVDGVFFIDNASVRVEYERDTWILDSTGEYPAVIMDEAITLYSKMVAPIIVVYRAGLNAGQVSATGSHTAYEQAQLILIADLYASPVTFSVENTSNRVAYPAVYRMLAPYRRGLNDGL